MDRFPMSGENVYEVAARMHEWDKEPSKAAPDLAKLLHRGPKEQKLIQQREKLRTARAAAELSALGHDSGYSANTPGQGSALDRAIRAVHQPAAPAPAKPVQRSAAPAARGPITAVMGGRSAETLIQRAARAGGKRLASFNGHRCATPRCGNNAAWQSSNGKVYCNGCAEKVFPKKAAR